MYPFKILRCFPVWSQEIFIKCAKIHLNLEVRATGAMDKIATFAAVFSGIFIVVFVITFLWGVGKRILRWTVITAVAYVGIVVALRATHLSGDGAPITMESLLSVTLSSYCSLGASITSRPSSCTSSTK
jgi:hypothetical protein